MLKEQLTRPFFPCKCVILSYSQRYNYKCPTITVRSLPRIYRVFGLRLWLHEIICCTHCTDVHHASSHWTWLAASADWSHSLYILLMISPLQVFSDTLHSTACVLSTKTGGQFANTSWQSNSQPKRGEENFFKWCWKISQKGVITFVCLFLSILQD